MTDEQYRANLEALESRLGVKAMRDPTVYAITQVFSAAGKTIDDCLVQMVKVLVEDKNRLLELASKRVSQNGFCFNLEHEDDCLGNKEGCRPSR